MGWVVCQQARQLNGVVSKMQRHRMRQLHLKENDQLKLLSRVNASLEKLHRQQRDVLRKLREFLVQHTSKIRHFVENAIKGNTG